MLDLDESNLPGRRDDHGRQQLCSGAEHAGAVDLEMESRTWRVGEDDDGRDPHGSRVDHVNLSWGSGFGSETVDEEKECESIGDDELKCFTFGDLPLQCMCSSKSIPARSPGTPELETRKTGVAQSVRHTEFNRRWQSKYGSGSKERPE